MVFEEAEGAMSGRYFRHEMHGRGYSACDITLAARVRYAPLAEVYIERQWLDEELKDQPLDPAESRKPKVAPGYSRTAEDVSGRPNEGRTAFQEGSGRATIHSNIDKSRRGVQ
jgi:hypothetical protein